MQDLTTAEIRTAREVHDDLVRAALNLVDEHYSGLSDELRADLTAKQTVKLTGRYLSKFRTAHGPDKTNRMAAAIATVSSQG